MTIEIPAGLGDALKQRAARLQTSVDDLVRQALDWYMQIEPEVLEEFADIEAAHAEALWLIEDSSS